MSRRSTTPSRRRRGFSYLQGHGLLRADGGLSGVGGLLPGIGTASRQSALPERHPKFLQRVLGRARQLAVTPLLLRLDGGNDAIENIAVVEARNEQDEQVAPLTT